jgi:hypothetical protein
MSLHETPMTLRFWEGVGGTLIEEYPAIRRSARNGERRLDGLILPAEPRKRLRGEPMAIVGREVIVVQAKASRLGMNLMGQTVFSRELVERECGARVIRSVALCTEDDAILRPLLEEHGCEVVVMPKVRQGSPRSTD